MNIGLDMRLDLSQIKGWELLPKEVMAGALREAAAAYMERQRALVGAGLDVHEKPFAPYNPPASVPNSYADRKTRAGRMKERYWLRLSGQMFRSQKVRFKSRKGFYQFSVAFEGMQAPVQFTDPYKKSAYRRTSRSERGGFEGIWRKKEQARRARHAKKWATAGRSKRGAMRESANRSLTVNLGSGEQIPSSFIAWQNDRKRKFIGMSQKSFNMVAKAFFRAVARRRGA